MTHVFCVQTRFTCFVSRHDSRVLCPDMIHVFCVQTRFTCVVSRHNSRVLCPDTIHVCCVQTQFTCVVSRHDSRVLCPDTIHVFCVQTRFTCFVSRHDSRVLCPDMIHLFNCPDNALIMVTQYILNTSAEADGLVRSTKRNRRHEKAGEVGTINIQETQIAKLIQCQRMALPQQCLAASTVQTRLGFRCSSVQTRLTCFVSRHDSRVLCPDMIHVFCVQT